MSMQGLLLSTLLSAPPIPGDGTEQSLAIYQTIRRDIRTAIQGALAPCAKEERAINPEVGVRLDVPITLQGDGRLKVSTMPENRFRGRTATTDEWRRCLQAAIGRIRLNPPPAERPIRICIPLSVVGTNSHASGRVLMAIEVALRSDEAAGHAGSRRSAAGLCAPAVLAAVDRSTG